MKFKQVLFITITALVVSYAKTNQPKKNIHVLVSEGNFLEAEIALQQKIVTAAPEKKLWKLNWKH